MTRNHYLIGFLVGFCFARITSTAYSVELLEVDINYGLIEHLTNTVSEQINQQLQRLIDSAVKSIELATQTQLK